LSLEERKAKAVRESEKLDELMAWLSILESEPEEKDVGRLKTPPVKRLMEG